MKKILFSIILSFLFSFQAYGAKPILKPAVSQKPSPSTTIIKPSGNMVVTIKKPDLIVKRFVLSPSSVKNGEYLDYELIIKNVGGPSIRKNMRVSFTTNDKSGRSDNVGVPKPGQNVSVHGELVAPSDICTNVTWNVKLDSQKQINESNENNNTASYSVSIQNRAAIGFCTLKTHARCPELFINGGVNNDIYIGFEVYNFGCSVSPAGTMDLNYPEQWPQKVTIPPIQPGKFFPFVTYMKWTTPGVKNGQITLNYNQSNVIIYNNKLDHKVNIVAP